MQQNEPVALKPCPFCGHPPVHRQIPNDGRWVTGCHSEACIRPSTGICPTEIVAVIIWNKRAPQPAPEPPSADLVKVAARAITAAGYNPATAPHIAEIAVAAMDNTTEKQIVAWLRAKPKGYGIKYEPDLLADIIERGAYKQDHP